MHKYINYANFEHEVYAVTGAAHYEQHKYILPKIDILHRERFLMTLNHCEDIPKANRFVEDGVQLPDQHYSRYVKFILGKNSTTVQQLH